MTKAGLLRWARPGKLTFLDALATLPIADTELLHLAHYGPIGIRFSPGGPEVVLILHSSICAKPLVNASGSWAPPYAPMALRCLPFRQSDAQKEPEIAPELCHEESEQFAFFDKTRGFSSEFKKIIDLLLRLQQGQPRLTNAAKLLLAADALVPLAPIPAHPNLVLKTVSPEALSRMDKIRVAALTADSNLAFELAAAAIFSRRWLTPNCVLEPMVCPSRERMEPSHYAGPSQDGIDEFMLMDDSSLFPVEDFLDSLRPQP